MTENPNSTHDTQPIEKGFKIKFHQYIGLYVSIGYALQEPFQNNHFRRFHAINNGLTIPH